MGIMFVCQILPVHGNNWNTLLIVWQLVSETDCANFEGGNNGEASHNCNGYNQPSTHSGNGNGIDAVLGHIHSNRYLRNVVTDKRFFNRANASRIVGVDCEKDNRRYSSKTMSELQQTLDFNLLTGKWKMNLLGCGKYKQPYH